MQVDRDGWILEFKYFKYLTSSKRSDVIRDPRPLCSVEAKGEQSDNVL